MPPSPGPRERVQEGTTGGQKHPAAPQKTRISCSFTSNYNLETLLGRFGTFQNFEVLAENLVPTADTLRPAPGEVCGEGVDEAHLEGAEGPERIKNRLVGAPIPQIII